MVGRFLLRVSNSGYFDQHLRNLDPQELLVDAIRPEGRDFVEQERRDLLARFGLTGDIVFQHVSKLSGGERNRAALAQLSAQEANFLILDEPTNHLDLWARDALETSLQKFDGTVLFVSHDRYFINQVADHLLILESDRVRVVDGNYDTYLQFIKSGLIQVAAEEVNTSTDKPKKRSNTSQKPKRRFPYRKVEDLEKDIAVCEQSISEFHASLSDPEVLRDGRKVKELTTLLRDAESQLAQLIEHWEEANELN